MKNNIVLNIDHSEATRMAHFLNAIEKPLVEIPYPNWNALQLADRMTGVCRFKTTEEKDPASITVFFCDSYHDANEIAKVNGFPYLPTAKWSLNGALLYIVESNDAEKVSDILSVFAGKE